jgi:NTP pyrophosphatase (non-canonical NTP hydrolase)
MGTEFPPCWTPTEDPKQIKVFGKLLEELGELSAVSARCLIQGIAGYDPHTGKPNKQWLEEEVADVTSCIRFLVHHMGLDFKKIEERVKEKDRKRVYWIGE